MSLEKGRFAKCIFARFDPEFQDWWDRLCYDAEGPDFTTYTTYPPGVGFLSKLEKERMVAARLDPDELAEQAAGSKELGRLAEQSRIMDLRHIGATGLYLTVGIPGIPGRFGAVSLQGIRSDLQGYIADMGGGGVLELAARRRALVHLGSGTIAEDAAFMHDGLTKYSTAWEDRPTGRVITQLAVQTTLEDDFVLVPLGDAAA